jgi:hypothetical protein
MPSFLSSTSVRPGHPRLVAWSFDSLNSLARVIFCLQTVNDDIAYGYRTNQPATNYTLQAGDRVL